MASVSNDSTLNGGNNQHGLQKRQPVFKAKVDKDLVLGYPTTDAKTISLVNVSDAIDATFTSVVLNVTKEV